MDLLVKGCRTFFIEEIRFNHTAGWARPGLQNLADFNKKLHNCTKTCNKKVQYNQILTEFRLKN